MSSTTIRHAAEQDAAMIAAIYNHYIDTSPCTFEEHNVSAAEIIRRIESSVAVNLPWFVAQSSDGNITGYAYASPWRSRSAYRFSVEVTVYLAHNAFGHGIGSQLYAVLFAELHKRSIKTAIGGITLPNPASVALHEKFGFEKVAHFKDVGRKFDRWVDVGYWQVALPIASVS